MKTGFRTFLKKFYKFEHFFWTRKTFIGPLYKLHKEIGTPVKDKFLGYASKCKNLKEVDEKNKIAFIQRKKYCDKIGREKAIEIGIQIEKILEDNDLGQEWFKTIIDYLISGWFCPPMFNLHFYEKGTNDKKRIVLELNPDTSLDDIEEAWYVIKKMQRQSWPKYKKQNKPSGKSFKNLEILKKDMELRQCGMKADKRLWRLFPEKNFIPTPENKMRDKRRQNLIKQIRHRLKE